MGRTKTEDHALDGVSGCGVGRAWRWKRWECGSAQNDLMDCRNNQLKHSFGKIPQPSSQPWQNLEATFCAPQLSGVK